jgi:hypothetical protein
VWATISLHLFVRKLIRRLNGNILFVSGLVKFRGKIMKAAIEAVAAFANFLFGLNFLN